MLPLRDDIPAQRIPVVNSLMIAACVAVYLAQLAPGDDGERVVRQFGMTPYLVSEGNQRVIVQRQVTIPTRRGPQVRIVEQEVGPAAIPPILTMLTCIFLHGSWSHILGNMWFLWIFGDNVEDRFGHFGYLMVYLGCGIAASAVHFISGPQSAIPTVGASGAIAGVMGAYLMLYPHAQVLTLVPLGLFTQVIYVPAVVFHGLWFAFQAFAAVSSDSQSGGVAWWAHIGGFVVGAMLAVFAKRVGWVWQRPEVFRSDRQSPYWSQRDGRWDRWN